MASALAARWMGLARWEWRRAQLFSSEPLCRICAWSGRVVAATVADHCVPHRDDERSFWEGEIQPLCHRCHTGPKQQADVLGYYELMDADGWVVRIGLAGGFPRIGDDLGPRVAVPEGTPGGGQISVALPSPTGGDHARRVSFPSAGRAVGG